MIRRSEASPMTGSVCGEGVGQYRPNAIAICGRGCDEKTEDACRRVAPGWLCSHHGPVSYLLSIVLDGRLTVRAHDSYIWRWALV